MCIHLWNIKPDTPIFWRVNMPNFKDLTGKEFQAKNNAGILTAIKRLDNSKWGSSRWKCKCYCGKTYITETGNLNKGSGCGCQKIPNLTGQRFGKLLVTSMGDIVPKPPSKDGCKRYWYMCNVKCDCGVEKTIKHIGLVHDGTKSCGCLQFRSGGTYKSKDGYIYIHRPNHPNVYHNKYMFEHRVVMEEHLGRLLTKDERVHHKNGLRDDNRIENLELWTGAHPYGVRQDDLDDWAVQYIKERPKLIGRINCI